MTQKTQTVIIGAGIVGVSLAYHLAKRGVKDIVLLDKGDLDENQGSTSHAPGGLRTLTSSDFFTRLGQASRDVYADLPLASEGRQQFFPSGLMQVANKAERFASYKRIQEMGMTHGIACNLLTPNEVQDLLPMLDPSTIYGGMHIPSAGVVNTSLIANSMRRIAENMGALKAYGSTLVKEVLTSNGAVSGVVTDNPDLPQIACERVVLCSNIWAPVLCEGLGVPMPLYPGEHQYIFTEPTAALDDVKHLEHSFPVTAMDDLSVYFRQHHERMGIGSYHHPARLIDPQAIIRAEAKMPFTPDDFTEAWRLMQHHMPLLKDTKVSHGFNGMFAFTVDHYPIVGESHIKGFWTSVGMWLSYASEAGRVLARWMETGDPGMDMSFADLHRFYPHQLNDEFLRRQSKYYYEIGFDILHPNEVASSVRNLRLSPHHSQMMALGGQMVPLAGIETPWYYESNAPLVEKYGDRFPHRSGYDATGWSPIIGAEHLALRETVGLMDWTAGIGPVEISGPGALDYLNYLCSNQVDVPVGRAVYTLLLTEQGKIKRDLTVLRLAEDSFWLLTGKGNMPAELAWIRQFQPQDGSVKIEDVTERWMSLALWGPKARDVLASVTRADLSNEAFPFYAVKDIEVGMANCRALRISYAGELGYEVYAPITFGSHLWDTLYQAGQEHGLTPVGVAALFSLRVEKGFLLTGSDMTPYNTPYEAGMGWSVKTKKGNFVGREAALAAKQTGLNRKLVTLTFDDPGALMYGYEPVLDGDRVVGQITSAEYGYSVRKFIALAYVDLAHAEPGTRLRVRYTGEFFEGEVVKGPLFDRAGIRMKA
jgi:glycine cleavage system aminomethyltransferase T/glycine/D-amino acid oxidase-like deaminating enzyme